MGALPRYQSGCAVKLGEEVVELYVYFFNLIFVNASFSPQGRAHVSCSFKKVSHDTRYMPFQRCQMTCLFFLSF